MFISYRESHILRGISYGTWYQEYSSFASLGVNNQTRNIDQNAVMLGEWILMWKFVPYTVLIKFPLGVPPLHHHCRIYTRFPLNFPVNHVLHCHIQVLLSPFQFFWVILLIHIEGFIVFCELARPSHSTFLNLCHEYVIIIIKASSHLILGCLLTSCFPLDSTSSYVLVLWNPPFLLYSSF